MFDNLGNTINEKKCPFCRTPVPTSIERIERIKKRVELDDVEAMFILGNYYRNGKFGFPQDYDKALELFVRAGSLVMPKLIATLVTLIPMVEEWK